MDISGIVSSAYVVQSEDYANKRTRGASSGETVGTARNTGPDTVSLSSEAMTRYQAMKNGSASAQDAQGGSQSFLLRQASESGTEAKKMDQADLLAFLKSETFAEKAVGYAKAVAAADSVRGDDEESLDTVILNMGEKTPRDASGTEKSDAAKNDTADAGIGEKAKNSNTGVAFVNGKRVDEKELRTEIYKVEKEVKELTLTYKQIMDSEWGLEEKFRISQPVHKRLDERISYLQGLKAQAQGLADQKNLLQTA